eukprot:4507242-Pyramimonas_sp.AAC.2
MRSEGPNSTRPWPTRCRWEKQRGPREFGFARLLACQSRDRAPPRPPRDHPRQHGARMVHQAAR